MSRVLVTGAASGLGEALVRAFRARGDDVLSTDVAFEVTGSRDGRRATSSTTGEHSDHRVRGCGSQ